MLAAHATSFSALLYLLLLFASFATAFLLPWTFLLAVVVVLVTVLFVGWAGWCLGPDAVSRLRHLLPLGS